LIVQATGEIGGAEVALLSFLAHVDRSAVQPLVAVLRPGPLTDRLASLGVPWQLVPIGAHVRDAVRTASAVGRLAMIARKWSADLIHSNGTYSHLFGGAAALVARKPALWALCDMLLPGTSPLYRLATWLPAHSVVVNSDATAAQASRFSQRIRGLKTVYPAVELAAPRHQDGGAQIREELGIPADATVVAVIGRLQRWKGQLDLLEAAPTVLRTAGDAHFLIVGGALFGLDSDYPDLLRGRATELGIEHRVHFAGHRTDVADLLQAIDIVVVPSRLPEPFGIVQIEAMAAGRPVVASAAGGSLEVVKDGETGLLVPPGDAAAIAGAVCTLAGDAALRERMGAAGRARAASQFNPQHMAREMVSAYREAIAARAGAR
jgi:glycosyltransferase involved in cell wall biosynthesis